MIKEEKIQKIIKQYEKRQMKLIEKLSRDLLKNRRNCNSEVRKIVRKDKMEMKE